MMVGWLFLAVSLVGAALAAPGAAEAAEQVRVSIEFRQSGTEARDDVQGSTRIVITNPGGTSSRTRLGAGSQTTRGKHSSGIFAVVQNGGDSVLRVATRVPYQDVQFYRDYATGAGYVTRGFAFEDVGTSLKVHADVLPDQRIHLRLVPTVSYFSAGGPGAIEFTDAATELVVENGKPVEIGGGTTQTEEITRRILGQGSRTAESETSIVLRAVLQP
jgi:type II/III secretion system protein